MNVRLPDQTECINTPYRKIPSLNIKSYPENKKYHEEMISVNVTVYSKKDCHLCHIAMEKLQELQNEFGFSLTEINIEKDPEIFEKYKYLIPIIEINGKIFFTYRINEDELKNILRSQPQ